MARSRSTDLSVPKRRPPGYRFRFEGLVALRAVLGGGGDNVQDYKLDLKGAV